MTRVVNFELEAAFVSEPFTAPSLQARRVFEERLVLVTSADPGWNRMFRRGRSPLIPKLAVAHSDLVLVLERRRRRADRRVSASGATTKMTQSWMINRAVRLGSLTRSRQVLSGMAAAAALAKELGRIGACPAVDSLAV